MKLAPDSTLCQRQKDTQLVVVCGGFQLHSPDPGPDWAVNIFIKVDQKNIDHMQIESWPRKILYFYGNIWIFLEHFITEFQL